MLDEIVEIVRRQIRPDVPVDPDTGVISTGLIDSFRLAALLAELQARFQVIIPLPSIGVDNFDTPRQMSAFITNRP